MKNVITGKDNPLVKEITKLMSGAKERRTKGLYIAEGVRLCCDAVRSGAKIKYFMYTSHAYEKNIDDAKSIEDCAEKSIEVSSDVFKKMCDTDSPQGFLCVIETENKTMCLKKGGKYAALERIQDPSNLGTILRTAEAMGVDGVILSSDCCDIYSPKVVRGSMGAVFRIPFLIVRDFTDEMRKAGENGFKTFASVPRGKKSVEETDFSAGGIMLIGNEGSGLKDETVSVCTDSVTITMKGRAESLNASAAAAILLYKLMNG